MNKSSQSIINSIIIFSAGVVFSISFKKVYNYITNRQNNNQNCLSKPNIKNDNIIKESNKLLDINIEKDLLREQLKRNYEFFTEENMDKIKNAFVCVVGLGGVGSHAVMTLIRSGVQKLRIIDYDTVTLSSLNRHAFALRSDVGLTKSKVVKEYSKKIFPLTIIEDIDDAITDETLSKYLSDVDYVIDCIDDTNNKISLLNFCVNNNIPVISSMGAGSRINPFLIRISDFTEIKGEAVCKKLKVLYKKKYNCSFPKGIKCVYSIEKTTRGLTDFQSHQLENKDDYKINNNERIRTIPVFASIPAIFGQSLAAYLLSDLANESYLINNYDEKKELEDKKEEMVGEYHLSKIIRDFKEAEIKRKNLK